MSKKIQWNFKDVPADVYDKIIKIQAGLKIAKARKTSIEHICYALIRKGAGINKPSETEKEDII